MKRFLLCLLLAAISLGQLSCRHTARVPAGNGGDSIAYARLLHFERLSFGTLVEVANPWKEGACLQRYVLVPDSVDLPGELPRGILIRTPLKRTVVCTTIHCDVLGSIGVRDEIAGVCGAEYMPQDFIREGLSSGRVRDLGNANKPDIERLIDLAPDAVFISSVSEPELSQKLSKTGIPAIECADYMETHPLGRSEWVKFHGLLFGRESLADSLFRATAGAYRSVCDQIRGVGERPRLLAEKKYGATWYVPCGESYAARLYDDAGADYIWRDSQGSGSQPLAFETVLERAADADVWIFKYNAPCDITLGDLKKEYPAYARFKPFEKQRVYACNTARSPFFSDVVVRPDAVLRELAALFHPGLFPGYELHYFHRLEPGDASR